MHVIYKRDHDKKTERKTDPNRNIADWSSKKHMSANHNESEEKVDMQDDTDCIINMEMS